MNISNILFSSVARKLKLKTSTLQEEKIFIKNLLNQITLLKKSKEKNYKSISVRRSDLELDINIANKNIQDLLVMYIINISFSKANTTIHVSDIKGNMKFFYSAGSVGLVGKQKKNRRVAISKLISLLLKKATFLKDKPIALHLNNVNFYNSLIINKLKHTLYIRIIKRFNQTPYNGCRKKKIRRKKYTKKFR